MLKNFIKKILKKLGLQINKYGKNKVLIDRLDWIPFKNENENFKLYNEGLRRSKNELSDNFSKQLRFYSMTQIVKTTLRKNQIFDFAECGCWKGHSAYMISSLLNNKNIPFHIFDSFEGLSTSTSEDKDFFLKSDKHKLMVTKHFGSSESFVRDVVLKEFDFIKTYKGWIPERFNEVEEKKFSFVHIDVDLYKPTLDCLEFFFPRLIKGGSIVCDDYNSSHFPGAKDAWDKYFKDKNYEYFYENPFGGCFLIK